MIYSPWINYFGNLIFWIGLLTILWPMAGFSYRKDLNLAIFILWVMTLFYLGEIYEINYCR